MSESPKSCFPALSTPKTWVSSLLPYKHPKLSIKTRFSNEFTHFWGFFGKKKKVTYPPMAEIFFNRFFNPEFSNHTKIKLFFGPKNETEHPGISGYLALVGFFRLQSKFLSTRDDNFDPPLQVLEPFGAIWSPFNLYA